MPVGIPDFFFTKRHSEFLKSEDLLQFGVEFLIVHLADDFSLAVDEILGGQEVDGIFLTDVLTLVIAHRFTVGILQLLQTAQQMVVFLDTILFDGFQSILRTTVVVGHIHHVETFLLIFFVECLHVRIALAAGNTP